MAFSSLFFLLFFLPLFLLFYFHAAGIKGKNRTLLIFSLIFYAWGGLRYVVLLLLMSAIAYFLGRRIQEATNPSLRKGFLILSVTLFLAVLGFFKYTGFLLGNFGSLVDQDSFLLKLALPLGISFYTFKLISYVADVYHQRVEAETSYLDLLCYVAMFFNVVQGPIVRYSDLKEDYYHRKFLYNDITTGIYRCCLGLMKKAVLADHCGALADSLLPLGTDISTVPVNGVWLGSLCYMLQIYLDFAAYSDIAIGLARMCGFHFGENFNYPYMARSVKDFWRRWHISLSSFFRDYVYIPLGGNRVSPGKMIRNLLVVWALTGLWHGASWNYVLWGLYFFLFIVIENRWAAKGKKALPSLLAHVITLLILFVSWIIFRFEDFSSLGTALKGLFGLNHNALTGSTVVISFSNNIFFLLLAVLACTPCFRKLMALIEAKCLNRTQASATYYRLRILLAAVFFLLALTAMIGNSYTPFLYNQF